MRDEGAGVMFFLVLILAVYFGYKYYQANKQITELNQQLGVSDADKGSLSDKISTLQSEVSDLQSENNDLNSKVEAMDNEIEDAQGQAWTDYENMGSTLENLETSDSISY